MYVKCTLFWSCCSSPWTRSERTRDNSSITSYQQNFNHVLPVLPTKLQSRPTNKTWITSYQSYQQNFNHVLRTKRLSKREREREKSLQKPRLDVQNFRCETPDLIWIKKIGSIWLWLTWCKLCKIWQDVKYSWHEPGYLWSGLRGKFRD